MRLPVLTALVAAVLIYAPTLTPDTNAPVLRLANIDAVPVRNADLSDRFRLDMKALEAREGGSVVVEAILTYLGEDPIDIFDIQRLGREERVAVIGPASWKVRNWRPQDYDYFATAGPLTLRKRDWLSATLHLEDTFDIIPSGKAKLCFCWAVLEGKRDANGKCDAHTVVARPKATLVLEVFPNAKGLGAMGGRAN